MPASRAVARQSKPPAGLVKKNARSPRAAGVLVYAGATYNLSEKQGIWPLLQFARAAEAGFRLDDPRGLAAIHAFLEDVIDPDDWGRFQEDMIAKKVVDLDGLLKAAQQAVNDMLDRMSAAKDAGTTEGTAAPASEPASEPAADGTPGQAEMKAGGYG